MATDIKISKKEIIRKEAAQLFLVNGFTTTSMRDIASHVGLEVSSLYNHITSKEALLKEICYKMADLYLSKIKEIECSNRDLEQKIGAILDLHIDMAIDHPESLLVFNDTWKNMAEKNKAIFVLWRKDYESILLNLIDKAIKGGLINDLDPALIIHSMLSITKWAYKWMNVDDKRTKESLKKDINKLFLFGLKLERYDR